MSTKKLVLKKFPSPNNNLPDPVESYAWKESGVYASPASTIPTWLLPNNIRFPEWINETFYRFRLNKESTKATKGNSDKTLFPYQEFIKSYLAPHSPYRGILVYHKLGSGKTNTAIAAAEPFRKAGHKILVLLPASLKNNFIDELKNWGNADISYPPEYHSKPKEEQQQIDIQLTRKIVSIYQFVSYNACNTLRELSKIKLENTVIIIDEVHNLLNMMTSSQSKQGKEIYKLLMGAKNCRFLALSGTPFLNYSYELALLFNILRGYMEINGVRNIPLFPENEAEFEQYFVDYVTERAKNMELFKRRITGLVSYYCGIQEDLYPQLIRHEPLLVPMSGFQFSYYWEVRQEEKAAETKGSWKNRTSLVNFETSNATKKQSVREQSRSHKYIIANTFRPNSRQACNFVFPESIVRPKSLSKKSKEVLSNLKLNPDSTKWSSAQKDELDSLFQDDPESYDEFLTTWNILAADSRKDALQYLIEIIETRGFLGQFEQVTTRDEETFILAPESQEMGTKRALKELSEKQNSVLTSSQLPTYSAKMGKMIAMMESGDGFEGKKFVYSNFRTLEGVEIFSRVLQVRGYSRFNSNNPDHINPGLRFAIISGTESKEERSKILKAFNRRENAHGEYLMVILGTSSAAEGISLKHVRQIHIMEPWWNEVRLEQVIGRGRRIGSHLDLPESERNVHVYQYLSVLTPLQKKALHKEPNEHQTTDEHIFQKAQIKAKINSQFLKALKEAAVDCVLNAAHNQNLKYGIYPMSIPRSINYSFIPFIADERLLKHRQEDNSISRLNTEKQGVKYAPLKIGTRDTKYVILLDKKNNYKKTFIYKKDDPQKLLHPAYALYDKVAADNSNEFIHRGFLVDKIGILTKNQVTESPQNLS